MSNRTQRAKGPVDLSGCERAEPRRRLVKRPGDLFAQSRAEPRLSSIGFVVFALLANALPSTAQSAAEQVISSVLESHIDICGDALSDPQGFINGLESNSLIASHITDATPDGRIFRISMSSNGGQLNTQFTRFLLDTHGHENCATYYSNQQTVPDASAAASGFQTVVAAHVGENNIRGGQLSQYFSDGSAGSDTLSEMVESHEFVMSNIIGDPNLLTVSNVTIGYVSFVTQRELRGQ